jgi:hypothetical protein
VRQVTSRGIGESRFGESRPGYYIRNMNPDSACYLDDDTLRVKYAAHPNPEKKKCIHTTMIDNLNIKLKLYMMINILKRNMQYKWRCLKILCLCIKQAKYAFIYTIKLCLKFMKLRNSYIYPNEHNFGCKKEICICIKIRFLLITQQDFSDRL